MGLGWQLRARTRPALGPRRHRLSAALLARCARSFACRLSGRNFFLEIRARRSVLPRFLIDRPFTPLGSAVRRATSIAMALLMLRSTSTDHRPSG